MSIDYSALLTVEQKREILSQRISQFASEVYQHELNKKAATNAGIEENSDAVEKNLTLLKSAIDTYKAELDSLPESTFVN
jgi:hypothetical protein